MKTSLTPKFWIAALSLVLLCQAQVQAQDSPVASAVAKLKSSDPAAQMQAADELANLGDKAASATGALAQTLTSPNAEVRWHAARALGAIGKKAKNAVPALVGVLSDKDPLVRGHAVHALGEIGEYNARLFPKIAALVADPDVRIRRATVRTIRLLSPGPDVTVPLLTKILDGADPSVQVQVVHALAEAGPAAVPALTKALADEDTRYWACLVLAEIGAPSKPAVPALTKLLKDQETDVRSEALMALGRIGDPGSVSAITAALDDPLTPVQYSAAYALGNMGTTAAGAAGKLEAKMTSDDEFLRTIAAWAANRVKPGDKEIQSQTAALMCNSLKSENQGVRLAAARALGDLGLEGDLAQEALECALSDDEFSVRDHAIDAVLILGDKAVEPATKALQRKEARAGAARLLGRIGPGAKKAVPALIQALQDEDRREVRLDILYAMGAIGPVPASSVPTLTSDLGKDDVHVQIGATYALGKVGKEAKSALPAIQENFKNTQDQRLKMVSAWAMAEIAPDDANVGAMVLPTLIGGLGHDQPFVRLELIESIVGLGEVGAEAVPLLEQLGQSDPDEKVREAANAAAAKLQQK